MYLLKQWREGRVVVAVGAVGLLLQLAAMSHTLIRFHYGHRGGEDVDGSLTAFFMLEALLIGWWAWFVGGVGIGRNLGENAGSFLLTRPRRRAWFVWREWSAAAALIVLVTALSSAFLWAFYAQMMQLTGMHPTLVLLGRSASSISLAYLLLLHAIAVLAFAGTLLGLNYMCAVLMKSSSGIRLSIGVLIGYELLRGTLRHQFRLELPASLPTVIVGPLQKGGLVLSHGLAMSLSLRLLIVGLFPIAAQMLLERAEI